LLTQGGRHPPAKSDALWISECATPLAARSTTPRIKGHTRTAFGRDICPHLIRDCVATSISTYDPEHVCIILVILGHSRMATSEKHYNQARRLEASRRYHRVLDDLRKSFECDRRRSSLLSASLEGET